MIEVVAVLRTRWPAAAACALAALAAALMVLAAQGATYRAEALLAVSPPADAAIPPETAARTTRDVLASAQVAERASAALGGEPSAPEVRERTLVAAEPDGWVTVRATYDGPSAAAAERLATVAVRVGLPLARDALPDGPSVRLAAAPAASRVQRPWALLAIGIGALVIAAGLLGALAMDVLVTRRGGAR